MTVEPVLGWGPWLVMVIVHVIRAPRATVAGAVLVIARSADGEIAEAMWLTRADLRVALRAGDWGATEAPLLLPGKVSIARSMLESWAAADSGH